MLLSLVWFGVAVAVVVAVVVAVAVIVGVAMRIVCVRLNIYINKLIIITIIIFIWSEVGFQVDPCCASKCKDVCCFVLLSLLWFGQVFREGIPQNENVCGKVVLNLSFLFSFALLWGGFYYSPYY